jgi:hypothetical protein
MKIKKYIGAAIKIVIAAVVIAFLGLKSLDFFTFTTPAEQWYYAYLGFGLTGGGVIAYLLIFMWDADTDLKKTVAMVMLAICIIGELTTAGFGLQIDAWEKIGYQPNDSDFAAMVLAVQLLGFAHAAALVIYTAGDAIGKAFGDEDKDGVPNFLDPDYKKGKGSNQPRPQQPMHANAADAELVQLREENARLKAAQKPTDGNPTTGGTK